MGPSQERYLHFVLEAPNLVAQGRLRDSEPRRRLPDMQRLGNGDEIAQVS